MTLGNLKDFESMLLFQGCNQSGVTKILKYFPNDPIAQNAIEELLRKFGPDGLFNVMYDLLVEDE